jgi:hypothetical protein
MEQQSTPPTNPLACHYHRSCSHGRGRAESRSLRQGARAYRGPSQQAARILGARARRGGAARASLFSPKPAADKARARPRCRRCTCTRSTSATARARPTSASAPSRRRTRWATWSPSPTRSVYFFLSFLPLFSSFLPGVLYSPHRLDHRRQVYNGSLDKRLGVTARICLC